MLEDLNMVNLSTYDIRSQRSNFSVSSAKELVENQESISDDYLSPMSKLDDKNASNDEIYVDSNVNNVSRLLVPAMCDVNIHNTVDNSGNDNVSSEYLTNNVQDMILNKNDLMYFEGSTEQGTKTSNIANSKINLIISVPYDI